MLSLYFVSLELSQDKNVYERFIVKASCKPSEATLIKTVLRCILGSNTRNTVQLGKPISKHNQVDACKVSDRPLIVPNSQV
jgi:hypothetical protein